MGLEKFERKKNFYFAIRLFLLSWIGYVCLIDFVVERGERGEANHKVASG